MRFIFIFIVFFSFNLNAQIRPPLTIQKTVKVDFGNQKKNSSSAKASKDKKAENDSLKAAKKEIKRLKRKAKDVVNSEINKYSKQPLPFDSSDLKKYRDQIPFDTSDLNQYKNQIPELPDSSTIDDYKQQGINAGKSKLEQAPEVQRARQIQSEIGELPNDPDEAAALVEQKAEAYAQEYTQQLTKEQLLEQKYRKIIEEKRAVVKAEKLQRRYEMMKAYADKDKLKQEAEQELKEVAKEELSKVTEEQMSAAMTKLNKLKRKYGSFSSLEEVKNMKPYSLKDVPLKDRLDIGGSLQVVRGNPVSLDINPSITWWYNQRLAFGAGGTYRLKVGKVDDRLDVDSDVYGFRAYSQYKLGSWFGHLEYENLNKQFKDQTTEEYNGKWIPGLMLGVGKYFNVYKGIKGNVVLMYNFLHEPLESPYKHPVIVRVGFGF